MMQSIASARPLQETSADQHRYLLDREHDHWHVDGFNGWGINVCGDDVRMVHRSGGLLGICFDRRIAGVMPEQRVQPEHCGRVLARQVLAMVDVIMLDDRIPAHDRLTIWDRICIGSDFDGAIHPIPGITTALDFDRFAALTADCDDETCDIHLRSQSAILTSGGRLLPDFIGRVETLSEDWAHVAYEVRMRCGVDLGPLPEKNVRARTAPSVTAGMSAATRALILRRYRRDFELFYPEAIAAMEAPDQPAMRTNGLPDSKESHRCEGSAGR